MKNTKIVVGFTEGHFMNTQFIHWKFWDTSNSQQSKQVTFIMLLISNLAKYVDNSLFLEIL